MIFVEENNYAIVLRNSQRKGRNLGALWED